MKTSQPGMKIGCLGWGSLVWNPQNLPLRGEWFNDGPVLPVEFLRTSKDGRLTLVIDEQFGTPVRTLWTLLNCIDAEDARKALGIREGYDGAASLMLLDSAIPDGDKVKSSIFDWTHNKQLDAVVWTSLTTKFNNENGNAPSKEEAVTYLKNLSGEKAQKAEEYIRNAPKQIDTTYRREFVKEFNWKAYG